MTVIISTKYSEKQFDNQFTIKIGSTPDCDFVVDNEKFSLTLQYFPSGNTYVATNNTNSGILFKGQNFSKVEITSITRFLFPNSDNYLNIKVLPANTNTKNTNSVNDVNMNNTDGITPKSKLDLAKSKIENIRVGIISEISQPVADLKKKISQNTKGAIFTHFALFWACFVCAFAVTNYITGLSITESADYIHLPTDLKLLFLYTVLILGVMLLFKQGMFGWFNSVSKINSMSKVVQFFFIFSSSLIMVGVYTINLLYYLDYTKNPVFPILMSLFFVGFAFVLASASAYYKSNGYILAELLTKYEFRPDLEKVIHEYNNWIGLYINGLSESKIQYISDKMFKLRIKQFFEILVGLLTAPFLAYGVSNTLANCFSEAAGWVRISQMRFSPVFLVLASFLIIFAFFLFVHAFTTNKKIENSDVIKHDGFSNYLLHCTGISGLEGVSKARREKNFALYSALIIILIEFTMNVSYFSTEIGQDFYGLFLSLVAALVPTTLLIAETFLLSGTEFEIFALEEIRAKADR